jgi:hypothetical protein
MALVSGTLRLPNGELPDYFANKSETVRMATGDLSCEGTILGGHITVKIEGPQIEVLDDEVLRIAGYIIDNLVLTKTVIEGVGASYTIENYWKDTGFVSRISPDQAPSAETTALEEEKVYDLISQNSQLRYAVRDFNQGLIYCQDCPYLFYRAIETLARLVCGKDGFQNLSKKDWRVFHKKIGTKYDDLKELHDFARRRHHEPQAHFTGHQHLAMMKAARLFLMRTIAYFLADH